MNTGFVMAGDLDVGANSVTLLGSTIAALGSSTTLAGGALAAANGMRVETGDVIHGFGTFDGTVVNHGSALSPGSELGTLAIVARKHASRRRCRVATVHGRVLHGVCPCGSEGDRT